MKKCKLLLFDLDGTLLQSDKTISTRTLSALKKCRGNDILIGVSTSRSEQNSLVFLNELMPDILISSGGALVKYKTEYIYRAEFSEEETNVMIDMARNICGNDCEITIDTIDAHYWNYKIDPKKLDNHSCQSRFARPGFTYNGIAPSILENSTNRRYGRKFVFSESSFGKRTTQILYFNHINSLLSNRQALRRYSVYSCFGFSMILLVSPDSTIFP